MANPIFPNFSVRNDGVFNNLIARSAQINNLTNNVTSTSSLNNGLQFQNIQDQVKINNHRNFMINNTIAQITAGLPLPIFPGGRTVTINNMTSVTTLDIYLTEGYPNAIPPTIIAGGAAVPRLRIRSRRRVLRVGLAAARGAAVERDHRR